MMMNDHEAGCRGLSLRATSAIALAVLLSVGAASRSAHADVVPPPPDECPDGTTPSSGHCGAFCAPIACDSTADCAEGTCTSVEACVETLVCAGMVEPDADLSQYERPSYLGLCESGTCAQGECQTLKICTTGSGPTSGSTGGAAASDAEASDSGGCGCSTVGSRSTVPVLSWLPMLAAVVALRRRKHRRK